MPGGVLKQCLDYTGDDGLMTPSSEDQRVTELAIRDILKWYQPEFTPDADDRKERDRIELTRELHHLFVNWFLSNDLPSNYVGLDASRPWQMYWCSHALYGILDQPCPSTTKERIMETLSRCRPAKTTTKAGFGGGPGQIMHLAPTYAAIMTLATICDTRQEWNRLIDRTAYLDWLLTLKQADGSFVMHVGGESDVRASYCALTTAALLNVLTPELTRNAAQFIANCQTYEGGFAGASFPSSSSDPSRNPPMAEAHGGYSFCALASYFLLCPPSSDSQRTSIDVDSLYRWSAHMQAVPIEGGGFRGRTNKLVDGCYSWWNGGLFHFIEAYLSPDGVDAKSTAGQNALFDREALQEYVLLVGQAKAGGLQDKPGKANDTYHTCYTLSGLSAAQNKMTYSGRRAANLAQTYSAKTQDMIKGTGETDQEASRRASTLQGHLRAWVTSDQPPVVVGLQQNLVKPIHPVFGLEASRAFRTLDLFYGPNNRCA